MRTDSDCAAASPSTRADAKVECSPLAYAAESVPGSTARAWPSMLTVAERTPRTSLNATSSTGGAHCSRPSGCSRRGCSGASVAKSAATVKWPTQALTLNRPRHNGSAFVRLSTARRPGTCCSVNSRLLVVTTRSLPVPVATSHSSVQARSSSGPSTACAAACECSTPRTASSPRPLRSCTSPSMRSSTATSITPTSAIAPTFANNGNCISRSSCAPLGGAEAATMPPGCEGAMRFVRPG